MARKTTKKAAAKKKTAKKSAKVAKKATATPRFIVLSAIYVDEVPSEGVGSSEMLTRFPHSEQKRAAIGREWPQAEHLRPADVDQPVPQ